MIDAVTLDVKSFSAELYQKLNAGTLEPVLQTLISAKKSGMWVEISNLVVPQWTDDVAMVRKLSAWIRENLGAATPLHFLRFFPLYKLADLYPTPAQTILAAQTAARREGLQFVYAGNVAEADANTYCPACKKAVIVRDGFTIKNLSIVKCDAAFARRLFRGWA